MSNARIWKVAGRVAALLVAVVIPACNNSGAGNGSGNPGGILWLSGTSSGASTGGPTPTGTALWVDPNSGLGGGPIGITALIQSTDDVTYNRFNASTRPPPFTQYIFYILGLEHPLSTDTSSTAITTRESELQGLLNGVRTGTLLTTNALPNAGGGGGGGGAGGGLGGGLGIGLTQGSIPGHARATKAARAHCKHSAYFHPGALPGGAPAPTGWTIPGGRTGAPLFFPAESNAEGDLLLYTDVGTPAYQDPATLQGQNVLNLNPNANYGRLGKVGVTAARNGWCEFSYSGVAYREALDVYTAMLQDAPDILRLVNWTNCAPGHWRGGTESFYWNVLYIIFPTPAY
jgi:hypothetical protein